MSTTETGKEITSIFSRKIRMKQRSAAKKNDIKGRLKAMRQKCPKSQEYSKEAKFTTI